jgi:hypothetical protein
MMGGLVGAGVFIAFNAAPVIFIVRQALLSRTNEKGDTEWYPPGLLVSTSAVAAGVLMLATLVWLDLTQSGAETAIRTYVEHVAGAMFPDLTGDKRVMLAEGVTPFGPGLIAVSWLLMLAVNGSLAQGLLTRVERNLRPSPDFALTALPRWFPGVAALAVLGAAIFGGSIGFYAQNLALLAALPFFFVGLAVVHVFCRRVTAGPLLLILFYIVMMVFGWPALFVAFIGLLEQLTGLRQRLAGPGEEV